MTSWAMTVVLDGDAHLEPWFTLDQHRSVFWRQLPTAMGHGSQEHIACQKPKEFKAGFSGRIIE